MDILGWITQTASDTPEALRAGIAAVFACLEVMGLGPFFPGELAVLFLGASFDDVPGLLLLIAGVTVGASAGDHVLYLLGRKVGPRLRKGRLVRAIGVEKWDVAIGVVERRGAWAVVSTRVVPVVRSLTPIAAGVSGMPQPRFTVASLIGSLTWSIAWGGTGFLLRSSLGLAEQILGQSTWVVLAVIGTVVLVVLLVRGIRSRRRAGLPLVPPSAPRLVGAVVQVVATAAFTAAVVLTAVGSDSWVVAALAGVAVLGWVGVLVVPHAPSLATGTTVVAVVARLGIATAAASALTAVHGLPFSIAFVVVGMLFAVELTRPVGGALRPLERIVLAMAFGAFAIDAAPYAWGPLSALVAVASVLSFAVVVVGAVAAGVNLRRRAGASTIAVAVPGAD
jgi:membrane protein DedA with SNARE-associated domain